MFPRGTSIRGLAIAAITAIAAVLSGCAGTVVIPTGRPDVRFFLPHSHSMVKDACPVELMEFLGVDGKAADATRGSVATTAGDDYLELRLGLGGSLIACTLIEDVGEDGMSMSGRAEQWNILIIPSGEGTSIEVYRHLRRSTFAVPLSDGTRERAFIDVLARVLDRQG